MFVRVTRTVQDRGVLVRPEEVEETVTDREQDWYVSPFFYGDDVKTYWEEHKGVKGYKGDVWTDSLYWDLDCKEDFSKAQEGAVKIVQFLSEQGLADGLQFYFSGNKGIHVFLRTTNKFSPQEAAAICYNIAVKLNIPAKGKQKVFDPSVYNINRIFRIVNTKHPASGLYKIELTDDELFEATEKEIRKAAKKQRDLDTVIARVDAEELRKTFLIKPKPQVNPQGNILSFKTGRSVEDMGEPDLDGPDFPDDEFDPMSCPRGKRRCIYVIENGYFEPGSRENALIRIAAYYKGRNLDYDQIYAILNKALERRAAIYPEAEPIKDEDTHRILKEVFSDGWRGGTYSCRSNADSPDIFLQSKCDIGNGPCGDEHVPESPINVLTIGDLIQSYVDYGNEALKEYPKTGNEWLDKRIRLRPRNYSLLNGANGSGKTSFMINTVLNLNKQKMHHIIFSMDMADTSLLEKLGATFTDYDQEQIEQAFNVHSRDPKIIQEIIDALTQRLPYTIFDFTSACDSKHIEKTISYLKKSLNVNVQVAFVDYAGRLLGDNDNEFANSSQNALMANDIAKRTNTHLMYLSQVSRDNGDHTTPLRSSRVAKNSGSWEENATFVLNVWRPFGNGLDGPDNYLHVFIGKNRSGPNGEHVFWWEGKTGTVRPITIKEFAEYKTYCDQNDIEPPYEQFAEHRKSRDAELAKTDSRFEVEETDEEELSTDSKPGRFQGSN